MSTAEAYADLRPLMFSIAYRMVGSVTEAEDIVQEAFLRYHRVVSGSDEPDSPKAYLSAVTTAIRSVISRDKLRHLGPPADIAALYEQRRSSRQSPDDADAG